MQWPHIWDTDISPAKAKLKWNVQQPLSSSAVCETAAIQVVQVLLVQLPISYLYNVSDVLRHIQSCHRSAWYYSSPNTPPQAEQRPKPTMCRLCLLGVSALVKILAVCCGILHSSRCSNPFWICSRIQCHWISMCFNLLWYCKLFAITSDPLSSPNRSIGLESELNV